MYNVIFENSIGAKQLKGLSSALMSSSRRLLEFEIKLFDLLQKLFLHTVEFLGGSLSQIFMHLLMSFHSLDNALCVLYFSGVIPQYLLDTVNFTKCLLKSVLEWVHFLLTVRGEKLQCQVTKKPKTKQFQSIVIGVGTMGALGASAPLDFLVEIYLW